MQELRGDITIIGHQITQVAFENCAPFVKYITKIDGTTIDHAEDLDLVMLMYNLTEYSSNHSETTGSSWFYSKDVVTNINNDNNFTSFEYKTEVLKNTELMN